MEATELWLEEYRALRSEMMSRAQSRFAVTGFVGGLWAFAFSRDSLTSGMAILCIAAGIALAAIWIRQGHMIYACRQRLSAIERQLNTEAGQDAMAWHAVHHPPLLFDWLYRRLTPRD